MNEAPDPEELARQGIEMLNAEGDARAAATAKTFFKPDEKVAFYGVRTSRVRQIESELFKTVRRAWTLPEAMEFCDILVRNPYLEAMAVGEPLRQLGNDRLCLSVDYRATARALSGPGSGIEALDFVGEPVVAAGCGRVPDSSSQERQTPGSGLCRCPVAPCRQ